jgi:hypothetical protein
MIVLGKLENTYRCRIVLDGSGAVFKVISVQAYTAQQAALAAIFTGVSPHVRPTVFAAIVEYQDTDGRHTSLWRYSDSEGRVWQP